MISVYIFNIYIYRSNWHIPLVLTYTANRNTVLNYVRYRLNCNIFCSVNLPCMIHLDKIWFSSSKVMLCMFTIHLFTKLQIGNHNFELPPSTCRSIVTGWDNSDFMSRSLDIKSPYMLHLSNNWLIFNYFQSHRSCHFPLRKSRKYFWNITSYTNWKVHTCEQVLLVPYLTLDLEQIVDVSC